MGSLLRAFFIVVLFIGLSGHAHAGMYIEPPSPEPSLMTVEPAFYDDYGDGDQSFSERHYNFIKITNKARRFLGVYIDRVYPPGTVIEIDNGPNDYLINPAEASLSIENLGSWVSCFVGQPVDYTYESRAYTLPIPDDLDPGEKVVYRTKLFGFSLLQQPFDYLGSNAPPYASRMIESSVYSFLLSASPIIQLATGIKIEGTLKTTILKLLLESAAKWWNMVKQDDYHKVVWDLMKYMFSEKAILNVFKEKFGEEELKNLMNGLVNIVEGWNFVGAVVDLGDISYDLTHLAWEDDYVIRVVAPQITEIIPDEGESGDIVAVYGKGFDPEEPSNNKVFFSKLNEFETLIPASLKGDLVNTENITEDCLYVVLPAGFVPGPVEVQVDMLTSNRVSFADDFETTIKITDPRNGDHLAGEVYTVEVRLYDLPENFPDPPAIVRFYVDETLQEDQTVRTGVVTFTLDMSLLSFEAHTLKVEAEFPGGYVISDAITVTRLKDLSVFHYATMRIRHEGHFQKVNREGETYGDIYSKRDWEYTPGTTTYENSFSSFQGTRFEIYWGIGISSPPGTITGHIGAVLSSLTGGCQTLTSFDFGTRSETAVNDARPSDISTFERRIQGGNVPLVKWDDVNGYLEYKVTGQDVCKCLTEIPTWLRTYPDNPGEKLVGIDCHEDSYLIIRFLKTRYSGPQ